MMVEKGQWVPMNEASKLLKVSNYKLSQLAVAGEIQTKENLRDKRQKLVNIEQIKQVLNIS